MFLALRELAFARTRFGLMGAVIALIAVLMVLLSGLSSGLVVDGVSGLMRSPVDAVAFSEGTKTDSAFTRSEVTAAQAQTWAEQDDVADAELLGTSIVNAKNDDGTALDLTLFGVVPDGFVVPEAADGRGLTTPGDAVLSSSARDEGVEIGDVITLDRLGTTLTVVGFTADQRTFGHVDIAFVPLSTWQEVHAGTTAGEQPDPAAYDVASVVALRGVDGQTPDLAAGDAAAGTSARTLEAAFDSSPGYSAELMTMELIKAFLYAISALVVGAFFTLWTVQRTRELAVMRAMGASTRFLLTDGVLQAAILLVISLTVGVSVGLVFGSLLEGTGMPFALETGPILTGAGLLLGLGLAGAAVATVRIASIDPVTALGENR
ncbi:ABC transporter permease [Sanguibacter inulinus]|uniref:ABC transporter permease n=1 Tax=Sanguibacter inulinus TaxID=60922 RepID=A0A853EUR5_9MICO|nr:ABC transporter permease [Sanguibacter inulinus]MBF0723076.1 ABC transporter permease [Sanguibacter inulinus]NYS94221.1 ABC transporter permease [Sanguibacter inulinus]